MSIILKAAAAACLMALAGTAGAQTVSSQQPDSLVAALQNLGYRAQLEKDSSGDPRVRSSIEGVNYSFWFYGCTNGADCSLVIMSAGFDLDRNVGLDLINDWNARKLIGRAFLDEEQDPIIDHPVVMEGGISTAAFGELITRWGWALSDFKTHIGFNG
jgi:hypothetical protein